jgi:uncharacterized protein
MPKERRFVLDSNVIVSAILFARSKPRQVLDWAQDTGVVLMSESVFLELTDVLLRAKFDRYIARAKRLAFLETLAETVQFTEISEPVRACRDVKDDQYLELAVNGRAECIVTGDDDLLVLHPFRTIAILTVADFLSSMEMNC